MNDRTAAAPLPRISIVVPSYRAEKTIARTLRSLADQAYPNLQIIVMDGASDDGTVAEAKRFAGHIDILVSEKDECQADALNKGFAKADGDIFGWLCADDALLPGALEKAASHFSSHAGIDVVTGGCRRIFNAARRVDTEPAADFFDKLDYVNSIEQPSTFWRAAAHRRAGALDTTYKYAFDWEFWCRLKRTGARFGRIAEPLSVYYFSDDNLTSTGGTKIADEMYRVIREYGPYGGRLADVYRFLYRRFDLKGYYDGDEAAAIPAWRRRLFHLTLHGLYRVFDRERINAYNWNFASRQERGLGWR